MLKGVMRSVLLLTTVAGGITAILGGVALIARFAVPRGWPADVAREYLTGHLQFDVGADHLNAIRLFHDLAFRYGLIPHEPWELEVVEHSSSAPNLTPGKK